MYTSHRLLTPATPSMSIHMLECSLRFHKTRIRIDSASHHPLCHDRPMTAGSCPWCAIIPLHIFAGKPACLLPCRLLSSLDLLSSVRTKTGASAGRIVEEVHDDRKREGVSGLLGESSAVMQHKAAVARLDGRVVVGLVDADVPVRDYTPGGV